MRLPNLEPCIFLSRPNRFGAWIDTDRGRFYIHVANSGRLPELLIPGTPARWLPSPNPNRKTAGHLALVKRGRVWVSLDARLSPKILGEAMLEPGGCKPFGVATDIFYEPPMGEGRADLLTLGRRSRWIIETKSATLSRDGVAMFPDAPTERGRRHLAELTELALDRKHSSLRPAVAFICARPDVYLFRPNEVTDPAFADALREARAAGVVVVAYSCTVSAARITLAARLPVYLGRRKLKS
jgi:sugar fermentation stimulation protein A